MQNLINHAKLELLRREYSDEQTALVANAFYHHATGTLVDGYHIEFSLESHDFAQELSQILASHEILPKLTSRGSKTFIYLKTAECLCNLLALIGATSSLMELNNEIALRSLRNDTNRRVNFDSANLEKQVQTAHAQTEIIRTLQSNGTLQTLPAKLQQTAHARLENPTASYEELATLLNLTKSGVVNRLRKICYP